MRDLRAELAGIIEHFTPEDGAYPLPLAGGRCIKISRPSRPTKQHWHASFAILAQGCKGLTLGHEEYHYEALNYIATPIDLPITSCVYAASPDQPFLCLQIEIDPLVLSEVAALLDQATSPQAHPSAAPAPQIQTPQRAIFLGRASDPMLETAIRLAALCRRPEDACVLGPLAVKELLYHLLQSAEGPALRQFVRAESSVHKIAQAAYRLQTELAEEIDVAALAHTAAMSRSAFFKCFKEVTALSPIQYQKRLRLLEARRLMTGEGETAEGAAFRVGYSSPSQFSREYSRMFGSAPRRDALKLKQGGSPADPM